MHRDATWKHTTRHSPSKTRWRGTYTVGIVRIYQGDRKYSKNGRWCFSIPWLLHAFPLCSSQVLIDEADKADADFLGILLEVIEVGREAANSEMQRAFVSEFSIKHPLLFYRKMSHYYTTHGSVHLESYAPFCFNRTTWTISIQIYTHLSESKQVPMNKCQWWAHGSMVVLLGNSCSALPSPRIVAISRKHLWAWAARELDGSIFATRFLSRCSAGSRCHRIAASRHGDLIIDISGPYLTSFHLYLSCINRVSHGVSHHVVPPGCNCRAIQLPLGQPGGVAHFQWSSRARRLATSLSGPPGRFRAFEAPNTGAIRLLFASIWGWVKTLVPSEPQNSWDLWMFIPLNCIYRYWPIPISVNNYGLNEKLISIVSCRKSGSLQFQLYQRAFFGALWIFWISQASLSCESKSFNSMVFKLFHVYFLCQLAGLWVRVWCRRSGYVRKCGAFCMSALSAS